MFCRHKEKIIRHGYQRDRCYRCDEALLLPALRMAGISDHHHLFRDLQRSLLSKQREDGAWEFRGKRSAWYTIEVLAALRCIHSGQTRG